MDNPVLNSPFYQSSLQTLHWIRTIPLSTITLPCIRIWHADHFFNRLWKLIDTAQSHVFIVTYAMDSSLLAQVTIRKLIEARRRGLNVVLFVDDLMQHCNKSLINQLKQAGGTFKSLNPLFQPVNPWQYFKKIFINMEMFRRHHEKLVIADERMLIGSANLQESYAGYKYGKIKFRDINLEIQGVLIQEARRHFLRIAGRYEIKVDANLSNGELAASLNKAYPNSRFSLQSAKFLSNQQPDRKQIQQQVLRDIASAKKEITILQPYYYPMKKFQNLIREMRRKGVKVTIITTARRDQPAYKKMSNSLLMKKILLDGIDVWQYLPGVLHAKGYFIDGKIVNIGSFNNDRWSWRINDQINVRFEDEKLHMKIMEQVEQIKSLCSKVRLVKAKQSSWIKRAKINFWSWFLFRGEYFSLKENREQVLNDTYIEASSEQHQHQEGQKKNK